MKRVHKLTIGEIKRWGKARLKHGQDRYGKKHLQRYGMVDVMEKLLDAVNVLELSLERTEGEGSSYKEVRERLVEAMVAVMRLDKELANEHCTDEEGGERVWWNDQGIK